MSQLFLDSGAFSIYWQKVHPTGDREFYNRREFREYVDGYAEFIKTHVEDGDLYANCDAIYDPETSWKVLRYLERAHGLEPVPVIHAGTDPKWVQRHLDHGYDLIGLGGMGNMPRPQYVGWVQDCFEVICDTEDRMPQARIHGFGITGHAMLFTFPFWSVDSTAWIKRAGFGKIFVPHKRRGEFVIDKKTANYDIFVADDSKYKKERGRHIDNISEAERQVIMDWLEEIEVSFGKRDKNGEVVEIGVSTEMYSRALANLLFFERLLEALPRWPWPYHGTRLRGGLG